MRFIGLSLVTIILALAFASCYSSGQQSPFASYFAQLDERHDLDIEIGHLAAELEEKQRNAPDDASRISLLRDYYSRILPLWDQLVDHLEGIRPRESVRQYHDRLVAAFADVAQGITKMVAGLQDVKLISEARVVVAQHLLSPILRWDEACMELKRAASKEGVSGGFVCAELLGPVPVMALLASVSGRATALGFTGDGGRASSPSRLSVSPSLQSESPGARAPRLHPPSDGVE